MAAIFLGLSVLMYKSFFPEMEDDEDKGPLYCRACRHLCENEEVRLIDYLYKKKRKKKIISVLINFD